MPWQLAEAKKAGDADVATIEHLERRLLTVTAQHKDLQDKVGHQLLPLSQSCLLPHLRCGSAKEIRVCALMCLSVCALCVAWWQVSMAVGLLGIAGAQVRHISGHIQRSHLPQASVYLTQMWLFVDLMVRRCPLPRVHDTFA